MTIVQDASGSNEHISTSISVTTLFQPIFSVRDRKAIGVEAYIKGYKGISSEEVTPGSIYKEAASKNALEQTDNVLRQAALKAFSTIPDRKQDFLLFLNVHSSIIDQPEINPEQLSREVRSMGIDPYSVVIEILESEVTGIDTLSYFVQRYRQHGFLIALDGIGGEESNLERIPLIKPDIIKIDKQLIRGIDELQYKREVTKAMVMLAHHMGALTIALGIERKEEALSCLETGFDMLQGSYFEDPVQPEDLKTRENSSLSEIEKSYNELAKLTVINQNERIEQYKETTERIAGRLSKKQTSQFTAVLRSAIRSADFFQCLYVVDIDGIQVSPTVTVKKLQRKKHYLFGPAPEGTDHLLKDYILKRSSLSEFFISEPYVSKATGRLCVTASYYFENSEGKKYFLCIDLRTQSVHTRDWI